MTIHVKKGFKSIYEESDGWELYNIIDDIEGEPSAVIDKAPYSINKGDIGQASVTVKPNTVTNISIKWSSDNSNIVFIDQNNGQFIGLQIGETVIRADITAIYAGEKITMSATASVIVTAPSVIQNVYSPSNNGSAIYNLDGTKSKCQKKGIRIIRMGDGSIRKVLVP